MAVAGSKSAKNKSSSGENRASAKSGAVRLVGKTGGAKEKGKALKWLKRVNKQYAVLVGLVLLAVSLPIVAYVVSSQTQLFKSEAAGNNRPYFSSITPKSGAGSTLTLVTTIKDADGADTLSDISIWMDNRDPISSRSAAAMRGILRKDYNGQSGWRYWGSTYTGDKNTCDDGSKAESCWMNYTVNVGGFAPSDNTGNKIYSGGSFSDSTSKSSSRTGEWKVRSVSFPNSTTMQIVWEFKFYSNFPTASVNMYFHANDNSGGLGSGHDATNFWTREGTGAWDTRGTANHAPVITSKPGTRVKVGSLYRYEIVATDADGDSLTYRVSKKPSWLSFSGKILSGTPADSDVGKHSVTVTVSDGKVTTKQAYTLTVYIPAPPGETNEPPAVSVVSPTADSVFRGAENLISWQASDADGIASISLHYSLDGETWTPVAEGLAGETTQLNWDVSSIVSGMYYVRVTATDKNSTPLSNTATSPAFSIDNNPTGTNEPQIRGVQPGEGDVIENTTPTISASYTSGDVEIDTNSVVMKLDGTTVQATVLASSCHYTPGEALGTGAHTVELTVRNVNGAEAQKQWSFTVFGEVNPQEQTINTKRVMDLPIIGQVAMPLGIAIIICLIVGFIVIGVIVTIKLIKSLKKDDETMELPQYYADYGNSTGPDFIETGTDNADTTVAVEPEGSNVVEGATVEVSPSEPSPPLAQSENTNENDPFSPNFPSGQQSLETPADSKPEETEGKADDDRGDIVGGSDGGNSSSNDSL